MHMSSSSLALKRDSVATKIIVASAFAVLTAVSSKVTFYTPFTPVPFTLQVMFVILSGLALGSRWGAISQLQYVAMGACGLPVFSGVQPGPTTGYLMGFVAGAFLAGWVYERLGKKSNFAAWVAGIAGMMGIYAFGAPWLAVWLKLSGKSWADCFTGAWVLGVVPFIAIDFVKAIVASSIVFGGKTGRSVYNALRNLGC